jgi:hypothetical protein
LYHKDIYTDFTTKIAHKEDRKLIKNWLLTILLRKVFGASADSVLMQSRKAFTDDIESIFIKNTIVSFPEKEIDNELKRVSVMSDDDILELLNEQKGSRYSFSILAMLYPDLDYKNNNFHQDHLHPLAVYDNLRQEDKDKYDWKVYNSILNLQMLDANENMSKNDMLLENWIAEQTKEKDKDIFLKTHLIPNVNLKLDNFSDFVEERKKLLVEKLKSILN